MFRGIGAHHWLGVRLAPVFVRGGKLGGIRVYWQGHDLRRVLRGRIVFPVACVVKVRRIHDAAIRVIRKIWLRRCRCSLWAHAHARAGLETTGRLSIRTLQHRGQDVLWLEGVLLFGLVVPEPIMGHLVFKLVILEHQALDHDRVLLALRGQL